MRYRWLRGLSVALLAISSAGCASCAAPPGADGAGGAPDAGAPAPVEASAGAGAGDAGAGDAGVDERLVRLDAAVQGAFAFARSRVDEAIADFEARYPGDFLVRYPTSTYTSGQSFGKWKADPADDWRSGFFPGVLWQMYRATGDVAYLERARGWSEGIAVLKDNPIDYDIGCRFLNSFGTGYRMSNDANDPGGAYRDHATAVLLDAAATLNTRFNMGGIPVGALRALDDYMAPYPVYIDGMMNLELLFEGWNISGRPASGPPRVWYEHAVQSAITKMQRNVRADGGTYHIVQHNDGTHGTPPDGAIYAKITDQGYGDETTWARGQAWAIYGFTMAYRFTRDDPGVNPQQFLETAKRTADFFISHLPHHYTADPYNHVDYDFVPPNDFDAALGEPAGPYNDANDDHVFGDRRPAVQSFTERDSSAASTVAAGLFELSTLVSDPADRERYRRAAEDMLECLLTFTGADGKLDYLARDSAHRGILANGSVAWGFPQSSLIYGDYYLLEAMNRYRALRTGGEVVSPR